MTKSRRKTAATSEPEADEPDAIAYAEAVQEIETILRSIDRDEVDVDELSGRVERAVELIRLCQRKLRATEMRVTDVLGDLEKELAAADRAADDGRGAQSSREADSRESGPRESGPRESGPLDEGPFDVGDSEEDDELPF